MRIAFDNTSPMWHPIPCAATCSAQGRASWAPRNCSQRVAGRAGGRGVRRRQPRPVDGHCHNTLPPQARHGDGRVVRDPDHKVAARWTGPPGQASMPPSDARRRRSPTSISEWLPPLTSAPSGGRGTIGVDVSSGGRASPATRSQDRFASVPVMPPSSRHMRSPRTHRVRPFDWRSLVDTNGNPSDASICPFPCPPCRPPWCIPGIPAAVPDDRGRGDTGPTTTASRQGRDPSLAAVSVSLRDSPR